MEEGIRYISRSTVMTTCHQSTDRVELTRWDLPVLPAGPIQKGLLFHKHWPEKDLIHHLKTSLSGTLDFFTPLAGRLAMVSNDDETNSFFIDCNNAGALFVHAAADEVTVTDIPAIVQSFFLLNGVINYEGTSNPLLAVQVTELVDGVFIGVTLNHIIGDGTSFWHFFNSWSEISRGLEISKPPIIHHRIDLPIRISISKLNHINHTFEPPQFLKRVFHFTRSKITSLKAKVNAEIDSGTNQISSLQALLAHLWRSVTRSRRLEQDLDVTLVLLIGVRQRTNPPLPDNYFGNAIQTGVVRIKASELLNEGLGGAAWRMKEMIAEHTWEKLKCSSESWIENPNFVTMGSEVIENVLVISSSPRFNVYGNDFGWGYPIAVRCGAGSIYCRKITVFPGVEDGSVDIEVCLSPETLKAMSEDLEFMDTVSVV